MALHVPRQDFIFKLMMIGDSSVGKTSLMHKFCHEKFNVSGNLLPTIGKFSHDSLCHVDSHLNIL
jgi:GTPase SAR1 family protein